MEKQLIQISVRWYSELNDALPAEQQYIVSTHRIESGITVNDFAIHCGVPMETIDLVLVNGVSEDSHYQLKDNDRVSFFPVFESFDISSVSKVRDKPLRQPKFILDVHLGKLAYHLRMLGFDTLYNNEYEDSVLCRISLEEHRTLLSKDKPLIETTGLTHAYLVKNINPRLQLIEVLDRFQLFSLTAPFTRCIECNSVLEQIEKDAILSRIPEKVREWYNEYTWCKSCDRIYWKGSHYKKMQEFIASLPNENG